MVTQQRSLRLADQRARSAELDAIRLQRRLSIEEQAEADNLADRAYYRAWRAQQREREAAVNARLAAMKGHGR